MMTVLDVFTTKGLGQTIVVALDGPKPPNGMTLRRASDGAFSTVRGVEWWAIVRQPTAGDRVGLLLTDGFSPAIGDEIERAIDKFREIACEVTNARDADDGDLLDELVEQRDEIWHGLSCEERMTIAVDDRPEYVKCVSLDQQGGSASVCGLPPRFWAWMFTSWEHADGNKAQEGRLLTCPDCEAARDRQRSSGE